MYVSIFSLCSSGNTNTEPEIAVGHWPFSTNFRIWQSKNDLLGQIYCTFAVDELLTFPSFSKQPANFKSLFQVLLILYKGFRGKYFCDH